MPDLQSFYSDKLLNELAVGYGGASFIADRVCPIVFSPDLSGEFQTFDASNFVMDQVGEVVSPTSDVQYIDFGVDKTAYNLKGRSWKHFVPDAKDEDIAGQWLNGAIQAIMGKLLRSREKTVLDLVLNCGNTATITTKWDAASTTLGTVIKGTEAMKKVVRNSVGQDPDVLILGRDVWAVVAEKLADNFGTAGAAASREKLAEIAGFREVVVSTAAYKTAVDGASTTMWTAKYAGAVIAGDTTDGLGGQKESTFFTPSFGKLVYWRDATQAVMNGIAWRQYRNEEKGSDGGTVIQGKMYFDAVETLNDAAVIGQALT